jgi:hypothetical protein
MLSALHCHQWAWLAADPALSEQFLEELKGIGQALQSLQQRGLAEEAERLLNRWEGLFLGNEHLA